jgi:Entner-Doudoroff aldolase
LSDNPLLREWAGPYGGVPPFNEIRVAHFEPALEAAMQENLDEILLGAAEDYDIALLPGGVTASECMALLEWGYSIQKFFPAEPAGGVPYLSSLASPLPQLRFCPTGGINAQNAGSYLALPNVVMVGSSSMMPATALKAKDWGEIARRSRAFTDALDNITAC